jgi:hypothetical protein
LISKHRTPNIEHRTPKPKAEGMPRNRGVVDFRLIAFPI